MKKKLFLTIILGSCLLASCNNDTPDAPSMPGNTEVRHFEAEASAYDSWLYINLEKGTFIQQKELGEWEYRKFIVENGKYKKDKDGNIAYEVTKKVAATGTEKDMPKDWHIAFHVYDPHLNGGGCLMTEETDLSAFKTIPDGDYKTDQAVNITVDMSKMMENIVGYARGKVNREMYQWLKSSGMGKPKTVSDKVFAVKFANGNHALIKFKDYLDATGKKKRISFDYKFIKK